MLFLCNNLNKVLYYRSDNIPLLASTVCKAVRRRRRCVLRLLLSCRLQTTQYTPNAAQTSFIFIRSYILQANEQDIKISIKQTQTQPQYSMPHGRRRVMTQLTPLHVTKNKNTNTHVHNNTRITED